MISRAVYILAVSGGVDSVVLLDKLWRSANPKTIKLVVAHFDHGIRRDSHEDAVFVAGLAKSCGLQFELGEGKLGAQTSEEQAREARYGFLRQLKKKYMAEKIITAHHQDDLLETIVLNLLRGTGLRGLVPMNGQVDILRPLLMETKQSLIDYAKEHDLTWREDSTNTDQSYLRNYVRLTIMPKLESSKDSLLELYSRMQLVIPEIDQLLLGFLPRGNELDRSQFVMLPYIVQREVVHKWLTLVGVKNINKSLVERCVLAAKTLPIHKKIDVDRNWWLVSHSAKVVLTKK